MEPSRSGRRAGENRVRGWPETGIRTPVSVSAFMPVSGSSVPPQGRRVIRGMALTMPVVGANEIEDVAQQNQVDLAGAPRLVVASTISAPSRSKASGFTLLAVGAVSDVQVADQNEHREASPAVVQ